MSNNVEISVVMPCYNVEKYINEGIESILNQTFTDFELIIIDDGSTDRTWDISNSYKDPRVKLHQLKTNKGNYFARNLGLRHSKGNFIAMLDADDTSYPKRLEVQHLYLKDCSQTGAIGTSCNHIDRNGTMISTDSRECSYEKFKFKLLSDNYLLQSSLFMRKSLIQNHTIRYNETFRYAADYDFVFQCSKYFPIYNIEDVLINYRTHPNNITQSRFKEQQRYASAIRKEIFNFYYPKLNTIDLENIDFIFNRINKERVVNLEILGNSLDKVLKFESKVKHFGEEKLYKLLKNRLENLYCHHAVKSN